MLRRGARVGLFGGAALALLPLGLALAAAPLDPAATAAEAEQGTITTSALKRGQRIKVDGRAAGVTPESVRVPCGAHAAQVGRGRVQHVTVPCGGELVLGKTSNRTIEGPADAGPPDAAAVAPAPEKATAPPASAEGDAAAAPPPAPEPEPSPPPEPPSSLPLGGRVFTYVRAPISSNPLDTSLQQVSASVWLEARPRLNEWGSAVASVSVDAMHASIDPDTTLRARVREAYVDAYKNGWEIRAGQQIIPWGNADIINPTDFLGAKDYAFFAADNEVRRLGAARLWGSFTPKGGDSPLQIILVWTPILTGSRLLLPPDLLPPGVTNRGVVAPPMTIDNSEVAARIAYKGDGWDAAISGFRGYNHDPEFFLVSQDATGTVLGQTYRKIWGGGLETSVSAGQWVFRFEGAYVATPSVPSTDLAHQPSHLDGVLGVERPFLERFRFQLQGVARGYPEHPRVVRGAPSPDPLAAATAQGIANANAILLNYQDPIIPAATLRLAFATEDETFEAEVVGVATFNIYGLKRTNYLVRPMLTYHWTDALKFLVGAESFGGPRDTPVGALRPFSGAFVGGDYRF